MELPFLLSMILFLAGIWIFLYKTIGKTTLTAPTDSTLLFLAYMHLTVLTYLALALYVFFRRGMGESFDSSANTGLTVVTLVILQTWPVVLICLVISFLLAKIVDSDLGSKSYLWILGMGILATGVYQTIRMRRAQLTPVLQPKHMFLLLCAIVILGIPYILLMSFVLAEVEITTDKEFYSDTDPVLIAVRAGGYVLRPRITRVSIGVFDRKGGDLSDDTMKVRPDEYVNDDIVEVEFIPQAFGATRKAWHNLKIARSR